MKTVLVVAGGILILLGLFCVLQGLGMVVMLGHRRWVLIGGVVVLLGVLIEVLAVRMKKK
jgi:hypothetical protein